MMGYGADRGIIPLICEALFERIERRTQDSGGELTFTVEVSYTEIYQESACSDLVRSEILDSSF